MLKIMLRVQHIRSCLYQTLWYCRILNILWQRSSSLVEVIILKKWSYLRMLRSFLVGSYHAKFVLNLFLLLVTITVFFCFFQLNENGVLMSKTTNVILSSKLPESHSSHIYLNSLLIGLSQELAIKGTIAHITLKN